VKLGKSAQFNGLRRLRLREAISRYIRGFPLL
jgi:hypothetical protein